MSVPSTSNDRATAEQPSGIDHVDPEVVRAQLARIVASAEFLGSERTRRFLRYVVEETLAGRAARIKAFSVALAAFDRDEAFDPQSDPIVRIEAGRLRRSLERYYLVAGASDPLRIEIPKGTYVPVFHLSDAGASAAPDDPGATAASTAAPVRPEIAPGGIMPLRRLAILVATMVAGLAAWYWTTAAPSPRRIEAGSARISMPSLAVLPVGSGVAEESADSTGISDEVVRQLTQRSTLLVLGPRSLRRFGIKPDTIEVGKETGVHFVLSGDTQYTSTQVQVSFQLTDASTGAIVWADTYYQLLSPQRILEWQDEIAREVALKIAPPMGAITVYERLRAREKRPTDWRVYDCILLADDLLRRVLPLSQAPEIRTCLMDAVRRNPRDAEAWTLLSLTEVAIVRFEPLVLMAPGRLDQSLEAAQRAVALSPESGKAQMALMMVENFRGRPSAASAAAENALHLSPDDPDVLAEVGMRWIMSSDVQAGMGLIHRAEPLWQSPRVALRLALALGHLRAGEYERAADSLTGPPQPLSFAYWAVLAAVHGKAGRLELARNAADELLRLYPTFPRWGAEELTRRSVAPDLAAAMIEGWSAAGLDMLGGRTRHEADHEG